MKTLVACNLLLATAIIGLAWLYYVKPTTQGVVYQMCQAARINNSVSENTCGELQDSYGMEYLCQANNSSLNNKCWVEVK